MEHELLGYSLGALDDDARSRVEAHLSAHPEINGQVERLRRALAPLEADRADPEPPADLIMRTLAGVATARSQTLPMAPVVSRRQPLARGWWRRPNMAAAAVLLVAVCGVGVPWLAYSRNQAKVVGCAENLRRFHGSFVTYADHHNGDYPQVAAEGPCNFAGAFVPMLHDQRLLGPELSTVCPGHQVTAPVPLRSEQLGQMQRTQRADYDRAVQELGGSYAYTLGYYDDNRKLRGLRNSAGGPRPLMADRPPFGGRQAAFEGNSPNHGGKGQNVLFTDGSVHFLKSRRIDDDDDIYLDRAGKIRAGADDRDSVLGSSDAVP